jgi:NitT/TauT family transport system substrate-binding protein
MRSISARGSILISLLLFFSTVVPGFAADKVAIGVVGSLSDVPFYVAIDKGYFKQAGIEPHFEQIHSLAKQVAPLSSGELDVASGAVSAGVYNAASRGIQFKIVADKAREAPGYGYGAIIVRKDLYASGKVKSLADLKGQTVATNGIGSSDASILNEAMRSVGLSYDDLKQVQLPIPDHIVALENKALSFTFTPDPTATVIVDKGVGVKLATVDQFYPNQQQSVLVYSAQFINKRRDVAQRFMNAYLRGLRTYMDSLKDGRIAGKNADEVIASLVKHGRVKDADLLRRMVPVSMDPNGHLNVASIQKDWAFLKSKGFIKGSATPKDLIDESFVDKADQVLGPYKKP